MPKIDESSLLESFLPMPFLTKVTLETRDDDGNHLRKKSNNNPHIEDPDNNWTPSQGTKSYASIDLILKDYSLNNNSVPSFISGSPLLDPRSYFSLTIFSAPSVGDLNKVTSDAFIKNFVRLENNLSAALLETYGDDTSPIEARTVSLIEDSTEPSATGLTDFKIFKKYRTHDPKTNLQIYNMPYKLGIFFEEDLYLASIVHLDRQTTALESFTTGGSIELPDTFTAYGRPSINNIVVNGQINNIKTVFFRSDKKDEIWNGEYEVNVNGVWYNPATIASALAGVTFYVDKIKIETGLSKGNITKNIKGYRTTPAGHALNKKDIPNNIVSDFREIDRAGVDAIDLKSFENDVYSFLKYNVPKDNVKLNIGTSSYISDLMMTTDKTGVNKLIFSINFRKLLRDNTQFSSFLDAAAGKSTMKLILKESRIESIRITRRRIKSKFSDNRSAAVGSSQSNYQASNKYATEENETPELVVFSRDDKGSDQLSLIEKIHERIKETTTVNTITGQTNTLVKSWKYGHIKELKNIATLSPDDNLGIRHFAVTDFTAADLTGGEYQYSVDINMKNGAQEYLRVMINDTRERKLELEKYYNLAVGSSVASGKTTMHYDIVYQRFTQSFIDKAGQKPNPDANGSRWILAQSSIFGFAEMMQIFYSKQFGINEKGKLYNQLSSLCNPQSGSPRGIESTLNLMGKFLDTMTILHGAGQPLNKQGVADASKNSSPSKTSHRNMIMFNHDFNNLYKAGIEKHMGYDCLKLAGEQALGISDSPSELSTEDLMSQIHANGIKTLTTSDMHIRTQEENKKYFAPSSFIGKDDPLALPYNFSLKMKSHLLEWNQPTILTPGDNIDTRAHSFLTPSVIYLPGRSKYSKINTLHTEGSQIFNEDIKEEYKRVLLQIIRTNKAKASAGTADISKTEGSTRESTISTAGSVNYGNMLKVKDILSSNNCVIVDPLEDLSTIKDHNEIIKDTKEKVNFIEKEFQSESTGGDSTEIKQVFSGEDFDEEGLFKFKDPLKKFTGYSNSIMEISLMKHLLPTKASGKKESMSRYNLGNKDTYLHKLATFFIGTGFSEKISEILIELPNQIKSLIHASTGQIPADPNPSLQIARSPWNEIDLDITDPLNDLGIYAYYYFNYKTIFKVEVLTGYLNNGDVVSPSWTTLTSDLLEELHSQEDNVFCRIVPWSEDLFNVIPPAEESPLYMPVYDQYFVISTAGTST